MADESAATAATPGPETDAAPAADAPQQLSAEASAAAAKSKADAAELAELTGRTSALMLKDPIELSLDDRFKLCRSIAEECTTDDELRKKLEHVANPVAYDGFEPSGRMHIAQGVLKALNVNKLTRSGVTFKFWVADYFAQLNNKMGGDLKKIQTVGEYMVEIWKAVGMEGIKDDNTGSVQFLSASQEINSRAAEYWPLVMDVARRNTVKRITRCSQIMGRSGEGEMPAAQIFYPCMQCADIFFLKADICQLGMDQRKVNMLAREYCDAAQPKIRFKPVILSHPMMPGLLQGQEKMSKSDPASAIFMEDSAAEVKSKIKKAFCPPGAVEGNPCLAYISMVIFPWFGKLTVNRKDGEQTYSSYAELEADYASGALHPGDLKPALTEAINVILQPVRDHFEKDERAKAILKKVKSFKVTK
mmetsp:Transcript_5287/g.15169  ORF Transcript_5287/g.15169 Transcript_5287/m.15169 type:complete len:418 (+) Transcript_5287:140-1393(+)|eukprot:CAMPEP_0206138686 /NCGR_PEP_ID=MMETSP1473-20131121/3488_1 /ASSEMBLY_ACC=CAM_ASM_001109 /TAXON_ID=1461547 /ORGANISM="Stichococcus sp, Strain RCC1054" /LENGTH=417 /DNA_ID=CAMNT_0053532187 /DNA_START=79 /DNA_END=1332 /DNA_ORIENTATION=+